MFKQGDWVKYKEHENPYVVDRVVGYNVYIYLANGVRYVRGWTGPRGIFGSNQPIWSKPKSDPHTLMVLDRDCTLIPPEVVDIMRGV